MRSYFDKVGFIIAEMTMHILQLRIQRQHDTTHSDYRAVVSVDNLCEVVRTNWRLPKKEIIVFLVQMETSRFRGVDLIKWIHCLVVDPRVVGIHQPALWRGMFLHFGANFGISATVNKRKFKAAFLTAFKHICALTKRIKQRHFAARWTPIFKERHKMFSVFCATLKEGLYLRTRIHRLDIDVQKYTNGLRRQHLIINRLRDIVVLVDSVLEFDLQCFRTGFVSNRNHI